MPYKIVGAYVVNAETGKRMNKTPKSKPALKKFLAALYANVPDAKEAPMMTTKAKKPKLGSGGRFAQLKAKLSGKVSDPDAVAAAIGRKKYGAAKMAALSKMGKKEVTEKAMLGQGQSLDEMVSDIRRALQSQLPKSQGHDYSDYWIREVYADKVIIDCPGMGTKLADYSPDEDKGFTLEPENEWQDVVQIWMPAQKEFQWAFTEKAGTSVGAKLGWQHRLAGRLGGVVGAVVGGHAGGNLGLAVGGPLPAVLGFAAGARAGHRIGKRVGLGASLGLSKIKTANKRIIMAGAKMLGRGFKKSYEQKYGSTHRAIKHGAGRIAKAISGSVRRKIVSNAFGKTIGGAYARSQRRSGKETDSLTTKAGTSAGAKAGWRSRLHGAAGRLNTATSGGFHHGAGKVAGRVVRGGLKVLNRANQSNIRGIVRAGKASLGVGKFLVGHTARHAGRNLRNTARFARGFGAGLAGKGADSFSVKQIGDDYRWFSVSSTAFMDKDRQIVTTAALQRDVELSESLKETQGDYGPLRFWHVGIPGGPGLDLGVCDFRMMIGRSLIESGTFVSKEIGARAKELADELELSIGFRHPKSEPDGAGLFHNTLTLERSLLPSSKGSNLLTTFAVS